MGVKSKIEQAINRARREGRVEDVTKLQGNLAALKKQRGDAAWARANTYKVKPGDSFFSIAGNELGSERWVQQLLRANPGVNWLTPGMEILLPNASGDTPSISQTDFDDILAYLDPDGQTLEQKQQTNEPSIPETAGHSNSSTHPDTQEDAIVNAAVAGLQQLQQTDPTLYNQFATLIGLPPLPPTSATTADAARQAALEAREARLAGGLPAKKPAGSKVWRRPAKQGPTPPPYDPHLHPGLEDDKNIKYQQREAERNPPEDGDQVKFEGLTQDNLQLLAEVPISSEFQISESRRPSPETLLSNIELILTYGAELGVNTNELAYILASAHSESALGGRMYEEYDGDPYEYFGKKYYYDDKDRAERLGNYDAADGFNFRGRGFVMLTWKTNYQKYTDYFAQHGLFIDDGQSPDLIENPDLAASDLAIAAFIMVHGMSEGVFTGRKLEDYALPNGDFDFYNARGIVNPDDTQESYALIGRIAEAYADILSQICHTGGLPPEIECAG